MERRTIGGMWPFKRKYQILDQLPVDGPWSLAEGEHNGRAMIVRKNAGYRNAKSLPGYENQVGIAVPLKNPEPTGLPDAAEGAVLDKIEDVICRSLEEQAESLLVAVITTGGMREFVFYTRQPHRLQERMTEIRKQINSHEIQLMIQPDKDWSVYAQLG